MVPAIDGFRGLAAMMVLLDHSLYVSGLAAQGDGILRGLVAAGYLGVDYFFVISGFVLFLPTVVKMGEFGDVRSYAWRRAARILPPYYVFLVIVVIVYPLVSSGPANLPFESFDGTLSFLLHLVFLQHNVGLWIGPEGFGVITVVWTLTLEVLFYVTLPLVAVRYYKRPFVGLAMAVAISLLWRLAATHVDVSLSWMGAAGWSSKKIYTTQVILVTQFPNYLAHFAAGMTAAWLFVWFRRPEARLFVARFALPVQVASVATLLFVMRHEGGRALSGHGTIYDQWTRTTPIAFLFALVVLSTSLSRSWAQLPVTNPVSRWLGDTSYGIYLSHLLLIGFAVTTLGIFPVPGHTVFLKLVAFVLPGACIIGFLSWTFVEQPARSWARRRSQRRREPVPTLTLS